ncbi:MAG: bifunctional nuclease family protein [Bacteroidetes bacterium]|nr:bifunctional nuclease family protein [Bacteroidota bacterium]
MLKIGLEIVEMTYSQSQSGAYALLLAEIGGSRRLPIIIGGFEAQSIAFGLERTQPPRPLTHDLFKNFALHFGIELREVIIHKFKEGIFHALLVCEHNGELSEIDARTSDAIALAIRFKCPVYTYESILQQAGIAMQKEDIAMPGALETTDADENEFSEYLINELEDQLEKAIESEDYEKASRIRDELNRRKKNY